MIMTNIEKFLTDLQKIVKRDRQNNSGKSDYNRFYKDIRNLFIRSTSCPTDLPGAVFEYWENEYVFKSNDVASEPSEENSNRLTALLAFLEDSDEYQELLTQNDWEELGQLVNYEAEDLPVDILQDLMKVLVSKGAY